MTIENIMDYLLENRAPNLPPNALAEIFDRLIWCLNDNGGGLSCIREKWLEGDDYDKVVIALYMSETFPYKTQEERIKKFDRIKTCWPSLSEKCAEILQQWYEQSQ